MERFHPDRQVVLIGFILFLNSNTSMSNRVARVSELLKRELGNLLERDFEFQGVLVTIHAVEVNPDLRNANVFIGIVGDENRRGSVMETLRKKRGMIQTQMMKRVVLKYTPQLNFRFDDSIERGVRVLNLLDEIAETMPPEPADPESAEEGSDTGQSDSSLPNL